MTARCKSSLAKGFTLVELVVVLIVAAILVSIAIPSFIDTVQRNRVATQANELLTLVKFARNEAVKRREAITVNIDAVNGGWDATASNGDSLVLRTVEKRSSAVTLAPTTSFSFNAMGRTDPSTSHCIALSNGSHVSSVQIQLSGQAKVSSDNAGCS